MRGSTYGILLVGIATVMWSTAGLFVRMLDVDVWSVLGWRSLFGGVTLALISLYQSRGKSSAAPGNALWLYVGGGLVAGFSMFGYIGALKLTTVANVLAIYSTVPFITAGIAFVWLREPIGHRVLVASTIAFIGVLIVAGFAAQPRDLAGSALAFLMTVAFGFLLVMARRYRTLRLAPINAIGSGLCVALCLPLMPHVIPSAYELGIFAVFGSTTSGIAYLLFMTGSRYIPAGEAGLIGLLDIVLGPLWVWLAFGENPGIAAMVGGSLVLIAVFWYMWSSMRAARASTRLGVGKTA